MICPFLIIGITQFEKWSRLDAFECPYSKYLSTKGGLLKPVTPVVPNFFGLMDDAIMGMISRVPQSLMILYPLESKFKSSSK
jgi:hypothetical protein